jgi:hypothetical protein
MIAAIFTVAACLASGWFVARTLTADAFPGPRWSSLLVELSLATLFGPGLASILLLVLLRAGVATPAGATMAIVALLAACVAIWWRFTPAAPEAAAASKNFPWSWALWICTGAALIFLLLDFQAAASANPYGEWDAMSIWNLRARFFRRETISGGAPSLPKSEVGWPAPRIPVIRFFSPPFSRCRGSTREGFPLAFPSLRVCCSLLPRWRSWAQASRPAERRFSESWHG